MDVAEWTEEKPKIEDKMKTMPKQKLKSKTSVKRDSIVLIIYKQTQTESVFTFSVFI